MTDKQLLKMGYADLLSFILKTRSKKECQATVQRWTELAYEKFKAKGEYTKSLEEFAALQQSNLGYMSGYYDSKSAARILEKANLRHPIFGGPQAMKDMSGDKALRFGVAAAATKRLLNKRKES